jgi:hypothetical protein
VGFWCAPTLCLDCGTDQTQAKTLVSVPSDTSSTYISCIATIALSNNIAIRIPFSHLVWLSSLVNSATDWNRSATPDGSKV